MGGMAMHCMKCGREISEDQVFCATCLELMEQNPVRQDVVVQIPLRKEPSVKKHIPRKKAPTPEEQVQILRRKNRWLTAIISLLLCISVLLAAMSYYLVRQLDITKLLGQNYTTAETTD